MDDEQRCPGTCWEWRRLRAWQWHQDGWKQADIATALGASENAVSEWLAAARSSGPEALRSHPRPGRPRKLSPEQWHALPDLLWHGPEAFGFPGQVWTCARVAQVVKEELGVAYSRSQVSRILKQLGWTPQVPITRAVQRDEEESAQWRSTVWPALWEQARRERRTLVFADESGFYLLPGKVKSYGPAGVTPVLRVRQTRDHLSVMGGLTAEGKVYVLVRREALNGLHTIEFLEHLLQCSASPLLVLWDGSPIHRRKEVQRFVSQVGARLLRVERLPGYAPELNPWDAAGWHHLKHVEMGNLICRDLEELHLELHLAIGRLRRKSRLVQSFFRAAGLSL